MKKSDLYADARTGQDCYKLMSKMQKNYREIFKQMFVYSSESCDLNKLIPSPGMEKLLSRLPESGLNASRTRLRHEFLRDLESSILMCQLRENEDGRDKQ
uniref:Uncharacterized protein n=1 Tax=Romanomermis culicivorax TaxID=13658 RepID=A0A915IHC0_ROMCU